MKISLKAMIMILILFSFMSLDVLSECKKKNKSRRKNKTRSSVKVDKVKQKNEFKLPHEFTIRQDQKYKFNIIHKNKIIATVSRINEFFSQKAQLKTSKRQIRATLQKNGLFSCEHVITKTSNQKVKGKYVRQFLKNLLAVKATYQVLNQKGENIGQIKSDGFFSSRYQILGPDQELYGTITQIGFLLAEEWQIRLNKHNKIDRQMIAFYPIIRKFDQAKSSSSSKGKKTKK